MIEIHLHAVVVHVKYNCLVMVSFPIGEWNHSRIVFNGAQGWKEITGQDGWEIVPALRAETIARVPQAPKMLLASLQDVADVLQKETDAADKIAVDTTKLPPGILKAAVDSGRLHMIVQPAWEGAVRQSITDMMQRAVKAGFYQNMPDDKIIYAP